MTRFPEDAAPQAPDDAPPRSAPAAPVERDISPIAGRLGRPGTGRLILLGGLLAGGAVLAAAGALAPDRKTGAPDRLEPARQVVRFEPPTLADPGPDAPPLSDQETIPALVSSPPPDSRPAPSAPGDDLAAIRSAPLVAYRRGQVEIARPTPPDPQLSLPTPLATDAPESGSLDALRRASAIGRANAYHLGDRTYLLTAGVATPCVLQTALDSATPGYVSCLLPRDVYSDNGALVLLEKGTRVLGEYRAALRQGQGRLFVLWTRAVTPTGVAVDLASPASDALGRAGFDGDLDRHFWDRFGGAVLMSILDGGREALADRQAGPGVTITPGNTAGIALGSSVAIPPTLRKPQGAEVSIFVAQDLDFSSVYGVRAR